MPLRVGRDSFDYNIKELMETYEKTGKIGSSRPKTKKKALEQALAIAHRQQNKREKTGK